MKCTLLQIIHTLFIIKIIYFEIKRLIYINNNRLIINKTYLVMFKLDKSKLKLIILIVSYEKENWRRSFNVRRRSIICFDTYSFHNEYLAFYLKEDIILKT